MTDHFKAGSPVHPYYERAALRSAAMTTAEADSFRQKACKGWLQFLGLCAGSAVIMIAIIYVVVAWLLDSAGWLFS